MTVLSHVEDVCSFSDWRQASRNPSAPNRSQTHDPLVTRPDTALPLISGKLVEANLQPTVSHNENPPEVFKRVQKQFQQNVNSSESRWLYTEISFASPSLVQQIFFTRFICTFTLKLLKTKPLLTHKQHMAVQLAAC